MAELNFVALVECLNFSSDAYSVSDLKFGPLLKIGVLSERNEIADVIFSYTTRAQSGYSIGAVYNFHKVL